MERMTNVLFRMLNDPLTRAALSTGGEDSLETNSSQNSQRQSQAATQTEDQNEYETSERVNTEDIDESMNEAETSEELEDSSSDTSNSTITSTPGQSETKNEHTQTELILEDTQRPQTSSQTSSGSGSSSSQSNVNDISDLQDKLSTLRHGFIEKHGSEPSVSLHYSEQSSENSTIKIGVGNELDRSSFNANLPSGSDHNLQSASSSDKSSTSNTSNVEMNYSENRNVDSDMDDISISSTGEVYVGQDRQLIDRPSCTDIDCGYSDSDDETSIVHKNIQVNGATKSYQPHVTQKYVGHRNAR